MIDLSKEEIEEIIKASVDKLMSLHQDEARIMRLEMIISKLRKHLKELQEKEGTN